MKLSGNTIFITGGGSGIGRGLAEALHRRGNTVIIAGRRVESLQATLQANPGMKAVQLDVEDPASIDRVAAQLTAENPELNVLINNAGIMVPDGADGRMDDALIASTVATNLLGPIRLTSALIEHLKTRPDAVVAYMSSTLAFVPMALTAVYSATKAGLHSYALSQRFLLKVKGYGRRPAQAERPGSWPASVSRPRTNARGSSCAMGIWRERRERDGATARSGGHLRDAASRLVIS